MKPGQQIEGVATHRRLPKFALAAIFLLASHILVAQTFEVATVKRSDPNSRIVCANLVYPAGRLVYTNCTLRQFLHFAWNIPLDQITGGPGWLDSDEFVIEAVPPADSTAGHWNPTNPKLPMPPEERAMLRALLIDRFHLIFRESAVERPALALELHGQHGALVPSTDASVFPVVIYGRTGESGHPPDFLRGENADMGRLAARIENLTHQPVVDRTGLEGQFDFTLEFALTPSDSNPGPSLYSAIQSLGLHLVATQASLPQLLITAAQRPGEN